MRRRPRARRRAESTPRGLPVRIALLAVALRNHSRVLVSSSRNLSNTCSIRCRILAGRTWHGVAYWMTAAGHAVHDQVTRFGAKLRALGYFLRGRATRYRLAVSGILARMVAVAASVAARHALVIRGFASWAHFCTADLRLARPRAAALGLGIVALLFAGLVVAWIGIGERSVDSPTPIAANPIGEDLESEIAALNFPSGHGVLEPAPGGIPGGGASIRSDRPNEVPAGLPPPQADPSPDSSSTGLALLPQRPPARPHRGRPQWLANAVEPDLRDAGPLVAIVIDDVGIAQRRTARTIDLPAPLTLAFIPYGSNLGEHTTRARARGHELIVHVPMEPSSAAADPGPNALLTGLDNAEIMRRFLWGLSQFDGYVGVSNHMGSRFMARDDLLAPLLAVTNERGLLFLDSRTTADTAGSDIAERMRLPNARRDVFLDNEITVENVTAQLAEAERIARKQGYAVAIGHPHDVTVDVLSEWIPDARARGLTLVPISTIVRLDYGTEYEAELAAAIPAGSEPEGLLGSPQ